MLHIKLIRCIHGSLHRKLIRSLSESLHRKLFISIAEGAFHLRFSSCFMCGLHTRLMELMSEFVQFPSKGIYISGTAVEKTPFQHHIILTMPKTLAPGAGILTRLGKYQMSAYFSVTTGSGDYYTTQLS